MTAMTMVMGPVGPETWAGVPPNSAAKADCNRTIQAGNRSQPGGHAESECQRQGHDRSREAAENITPERTQIEFEHPDLAVLQGRT